MSQTMEQIDGSSLRESEDPDKKQKSRRPPNTAFRQQRLKAWQPILTPKTVLPLFFAIGVIFAPIGGLLLYASASVQEINIDYSNCVGAGNAPNCTSDNTTYATIPSQYVTSYFKNSTPDNKQPKWCQTSINVTFNPVVTYESSVCRLQWYMPDRLKGPILLYYQLTNFYQNHRRYVKSFDQDQLSGKARSKDDIDKSDCDPLRTDSNGKIYYPCGLIANSLFNDTYESPLLLNQGGSASNTPTPYPMTSKGTAWASDARLYGNTSYNYDQVVPPPNWRVQYPYYNASTIPFKNINTDEAFQVWMRTAGLPTFSKLALRSQDDNQYMEIGTYQMDIYDYFPVLKYDGTKSILLSTRTVMGGRNPFLGISYVVVGGICILLGAIFTATHLIRPRKLGDHNYLSWNTDQPTTATTTGRAARPGDANA